MAAAAPSIVFLSRAPVIHERGGSTTCALNLLGLLAARGARVTVVATTGASRSPRLFFRKIVDLPPGVVFDAPGYLRLGRWFVAPWKAKAWARAVVRAAVGRPVLRTLAAILRRQYGLSLFAEAWDLTPPTGTELALAFGALDRYEAETLVANYAHWGPLLTLVSVAEGNAPSLRRTAILMHDLLSARVERFRSAGLPLDCPPITRAEEFGWLGAADAVLAVQAAEADAIRPHVHSRVLVQPMVLPRVDLPESRRVAGRCLFVGSDIAPNRDALRFLLEEIWPLVLRAWPAATLAIVGRVARAVPAEADPSVRAVGPVEDLEGVYAEAEVVLVPLRLGTGLKIKLLEAMRHGRAVVTTPVGIQGLEAHAAELPVAEDAAGFAQETVRQLRDPEARRRSEAAGARLVATLYGPEQALREDFCDALFGPALP